MALVYDIYILLDNYAYNGCVYTQYSCHVVPQN